jgi:hypothetical protein
LNAGDQAEAPTVSCPSAGNCVIGGSYTSSGGHSPAFLASQRNGKWSKAIEVPGTKRLNVRGDAAVNSVSCPAVGKCSAGGFAAHQAFVVSQG